MLTMELVSDSLPAGKRIILDLTNPQVLEDAKKNPITIKEGIEYKYGVCIFCLSGQLLMLCLLCLAYAWNSKSTTLSSRESLI
jgi:hypothetical protein